MRFPTLAAIVVLLTAHAGAWAENSKPFELQDGDRVVLIGGTFIEREQSYSYLETLLRTRWADRKMTFRNLGWSGDNVAGASRGYFEGADVGFARLTKTVHELKPTVILIGYGMTESFEGEAGLSAFRAGLERMLDMLKDLNARETVLVGPIQHERLDPPMPDPAEHNQSIRTYADAMKEIAGKRGMRFVDLYDLTKPPARLTQNGIHLSSEGYWQAAKSIAGQLQASLKSEWSIAESGAIKAASDAPEKIRQLSIQKNIQFFNQWRPANETYIFGFRAAEQGRNAVEMPQFSQPIEKLEEEIARLAQTIQK